MQHWLFMLTFLWLFFCVAILFMTPSIPSTGPFPYDVAEKSQHQGLIQEYNMGVGLCDIRAMCLSPTSVSRILRPS